MATESWAGGTITSGADATSQSLKPRGGYIPIQDVPNAPATVQMPSVTYPTMFQQKFEPVRQEIDMESRASKLMQKELPSSFEEAQNIRTEAAGKGQAAIGKALSSAGENVGKAFGQVGNVLAQLHAKAMEDKGKTDELRGQKAMELYRQGLSSDLDSLPPDKWDSAKAKRDKELTTVLSSLGQTKGTRDRIQVSGNAVIESGNISLIATRDKKIMQDNYAFGENMVQDGRNEKNYHKADEGAIHMHDIGAWGDKRFKVEMEHNRYLEGVDLMDAAKKTPQGAMHLRDQAEVVRRGGKSTDFPVLNTNPTMAPNVEFEAEQAIKLHKQNGTDKIKELMQGGQIANKEDIARFGKELGLEATTIKAMQGVSEFNIPMTAQGHVAAREAVATYEPATDKDGKEFEKRWAIIQTTVDKPNQPFFEGMLRDKLKNSMENKPSSAQDREHDQAVKDAIAQEKMNLLGDPAKRDALISARAKQDKMAKGEFGKEVVNRAHILGIPVPFTGKSQDVLFTPEEKAALEDSGKALLDKLNAIDGYQKSHSDFQPGDLQRDVGVNHPTSANMQENAGKAADSAVPRATPVPSTQVSGVPTKEDLTLARTVPPVSAGQGHVGKRNIQALGKGPAWQEAFVSPGERSDMRGTAYTKREEGGDQVASRRGPLNTYEKYEEGLVPYVSVAMDPKSEWQGQYLISTAHPGVVFKVEDTGSAFKGKGETAVDIAFEKQDQATNYESQGTWKVVSPEEATRISGQGAGTASRDTYSGGPLNIHNEVDPTLPAMSRPRTVPITKIVVHGDVLTDVNKLISVQKADDRGYHYYIGRDGGITMVVPPDRVAYHIKGANSDSIGIVIAGADNGKMPTPAQDKAARQLISQLGRQYHINPADVRGHGERQPGRRDPREGGNVAREIREQGFV